MDNTLIRVLIADDSLFMRTLIADMFKTEQEFEVVGTAKDGREALQKVSKYKPDIITLDLSMPGWDGLTTLRKIMAECPTPVIILSAYSKKDADITIRCLNAGAIGFVLKPSGELSLDIEDVKSDLLAQVRAASRINPKNIRSSIRGEPRQSRREPITANKIIVIGASTGGHQILETILFSLLSPLAAPIIVIQHMPSKIFTESFAEHLNKTGNLEIKVAGNGETIKPGGVYLTPGGYQTRLERNDHLVRAKVGKAGAGDLTPSINETMTSIVEIYKESTLGIILSGMGCDGLEGMKAIKHAGGKTIVQDESSLIFGMPKAVIDAGFADDVLPVNKIIKKITEFVNCN